jgi:hypothetical protein
MSRDWNEHKYCNAESLWCWVDEEAQIIEAKLESYKDLCGENYKLLLMGRKEMLDKIGDWLHENETALGEIAARWGLGQKG